MSTNKPVLVDRMETKQKHTPAPSVSGGQTLYIVMMLIFAAIFFACILLMSAIFRATGF